MTVRELTRAVHVFTTVDDIVAAATDRIAQAGAQAIAARGRFLVALAGGSTPRPVYARLAHAFANAIDWSLVHIFWGDERCVPAQDTTSNFRLAAESLLQHVPIPEAQVHRVRTEVGCSAAAAQYDALLRAFFGGHEPPEVRDAAFDLTLLGIGEDGHTASLFPGSPALAASGWATAASAPPRIAPRERVTLTLPALAASREVLFVVTGETKRAAVRAALGAQAADPSASPAARVVARERVSWMTGP
jgi:6-phosphogluconolactonase